MTYPNRSRTRNATQSEPERVNVAAIDVLVQAVRGQFTADQCRQLSERFALLADVKEARGERS